jgi:hypothetical protein
LGWVYKNCEPGNLALPYKKNGVWVRHLYGIHVRTRVALMH